jgi:hypothetical protein
MELYKLQMLAHPPELTNGPATYTLFAREASPSGSVQSANFPSWDSLARKLASVGVGGEGELQKAKRELDVNRYYSITGVSLSPAQIELLGFIRKPAPTLR